MLAAVIAEGVAIALLGVLVLGLLRSHALILKALHELGAGLELEKDAGTVSPPRGRWPAGRPGPVPVEHRVGGRARDPQGLEPRRRHRRHRPRPGRPTSTVTGRRITHAARVPHRRAAASARPSGTSSGPDRRRPRRRQLRGGREGPRGGVARHLRALAGDLARWCSRRRRGSTTTSPALPTSSTSRAAGHRRGFGDDLAARCAT